MQDGFLKAYLDEVQLTRRFGVAETSYYPALKTLFDSVGSHLKPKVTLVLHPRSQGAGIPDGGLFLYTKAVRAEEFIPYDSQNTLPDRGAVEVKPPTEDVDRVAFSEQGRKYVNTYGHLLVTNLRHFALYRRTTTDPEKIDEVVLSSSDAAFTALLDRPVDAEALHGTAVREFLTRACLAGVPLDKPQTVASFLASYAREALRRAEHAPDTAALDAVRKALQDALGITFEKEEGRHFFLSTLVQTLFYGLFSGWVLWNEQNTDTAEKFRRGDTVDYLRVPMVDRLFQNLSGPNTLEPLGLKELLNRAVDVLNRVDRGPFFKAFDEGLAVQYFYEPFLAAFDPELRKQLGVWYTPKEIVRYQVKRVDQLLRRELGLPDGLADESVVVLDPCCGTGTYLVEVMALIEDRLTQRYGAALAPAKLKQAALRRIFGFELIPAPYVVAHLQLGLLLNRKHASLNEGERVQVYLTNSLTGWDPKEDAKQQLDLLGLHQEREAALSVKRERSILVILGNPPYNGFAGMSESTEERALSDFYRKVREGPEPQGQGLNDLYVRFFRMAERRITEGHPGHGIISFISNYSWLDSLSCPGMRERLLDAFDSIWVDNLNGDKYSTGKTTPDGKPDPSVFSTPRNKEGIQPGTAITTLLLAHRDFGMETQHSPVLRYRDFWGVNKRTEILNSGGEESFTKGYSRLVPEARLGFPFKPRTVQVSYLDWPSLPELIPVHFPGVQTKRDEFVVQIDRARLEKLLSLYASKSSNKDMQSACPRSMEVTRQYDPSIVRPKIQTLGIDLTRIVLTAYRPFDNRSLFWEISTGLLSRPVPNYSASYQRNGLQLVSQQTARRKWSPPFVTQAVVCLDLFDRGASTFPLYADSRVSSTKSLFEDDIENTGPRDFNISILAESVIRACELQAFDIPFFSCIGNNALLILSRS